MTTLIVFLLLLGLPGVLLAGLALAAASFGLTGLTGLLGFCIWIVQSARGRHQTLRGARS